MPQSYLFSIHVFLHGRFDDFGQFIFPATFLFLLVLYDSSDERYGGEMAA